MAVSASLFISIEGNQNGKKSESPKNPVSLGVKLVHGAADWWKNDPPGNKNHSATQNASLSEQRYQRRSELLPSNRQG